MLEDASSCYTRAATVGADALPWSSGVILELVILVVVYRSKKYPVGHALVVA